MLTTVGATHSSTSTVGDVLENGRHEAELVEMPSPRLGAHQRTTLEKEKDGQTETMGRYAVNKSSLKSLEDWDLVDSSQGLAKLQHKLRQTVRREDTTVRSGYSGTRRSRMWLPHSC